MGCATTNFTDSETETDYEVYEAYIQHGVTTGYDGNNKRKSSNMQNHEQFRKTSIVTKDHLRSEVSISEQEDLDAKRSFIETDRGYEVSELKFDRNKHGFDSHSRKSLSQRISHRNMGTKDQNDFKPESLTFEPHNERGFGTSSRGFDTDDERFKANHQYIEHDEHAYEVKHKGFLNNQQVQGTINVALVLKEEYSDTPSDEGIAPAYQKGAEIMCRFRPEEGNEDDQCVQYGDLDADLKQDNDWELCDDDDRWDALTKDQTVCEVHTPKGSATGNTHDFEFDRLFPPKCSNQRMYNVLRRQWFPSLVGGMSVGVIPYGVTGSGKSYTVHGTRDDPGIAPLFCEEVFERLRTNYGGLDFSTRIRVTFLEIYENKVIDLLQYRRETRRSHAFKPLNPGRGLLVNHDKEKPFSRTPVPRATDLEVSNRDELLEAFWMGYNRLRRLKLKENGLERTVSLSNSILILTIMRKHKATGMTTNAQFQVVDIGGPFMSKELTRLDGTSLTPNESRVLAGLNQSLVAFRKVMLFSDAKSTGRHKPYRDSKVTQIMEPLLKKGKTAIIIHVSECSQNAKKTIETLRFGFKASQLFKIDIEQDVALQQTETRIEVEEEEAVYYTNRGRAFPRGDFVT